MVVIWSSLPSSICPGRSYTLNTFTQMLHLGMRRAQVAATFVQAMPGTGGPKNWPTTVTQRRVRRSIHPWRCGVNGKANCRNLRRRRSSMSSVFSVVIAYIQQLLNRLFINNMLSCCPSWRWCTQLEASHCSFSCSKNVRMSVKSSGR